MNKISISFFIKLSIIAVGVIGIAVCLFWFPFDGEFSGSHTELISETAYYLRLGFYLACTLPCFIILGIGWALTADIKSENEFSLPAAKKFRAVFFLLFFDCLFFLFGNFLLILLGLHSSFVLIYIALGIVGIILSFLSYVLSVYILKAEKIKEENESII